MTLITISASYGAGGSRVAPAVAQRLGVPLLGRPPVPETAEHDGEELAANESAGSGPARLLSRIVSIGVAWGTPAGMTLAELLPDQALRHQMEEEIHVLAATGAGVILGRGAVVVLHDDPRALHVLLDGPVEARVAQAMVIESIDRATAQRRRARVDRFRRAYTETLYGVDTGVPGVFHITLDSTVIAWEDCVDLIIAAARARERGGR